MRYAYALTGVDDYSTRVVDGVATNTIQDDGDAGTIAFSNIQYSVVEGQISTMTVTRFNRDYPSGQIVVAYESRDGTAKSASNDYTTTSGTLVFADGVTVLTATITSLQDQAFEVRLLRACTSTASAEQGACTTHVSVLCRLCRYSLHACRVFYRLILH